eukprot:7351924-Lingulodinium_polyedra.AAC.1
MRWCVAPNCGDWSPPCCWCVAPNCGDGHHPVIGALHPTAPAKPDPLRRSSEAILGAPPHLEPKWLG